MKIKVSVNPKILKWAREECNCSHDDVSKKIDVETNVYEAWEKNGRSIPYSKLKELAIYFKRQVATFFLPDIPPKNKRPKDFRNVTGDGFSKEVLLVFRKVNDFRELAFEFEGENYWTEKYAWRTELQKQNNSIEWLRNRLGIDLQTQLSFRNDSEAYRYWRTAIERNLGIMVFQFSMPLEEIQGFCYSDFIPNCIVVNSKHPYTARTFTLFHELGHLLNSESGACMPDRVQENMNVEFRCNKFAGQFLIPENSITETDDLDEIRKYSSRLKISREVYLRRLYESDMIDDKKFFNLLKAIKASYKELKSKKSGGVVKPTVRSKAERGETFYNLVIKNINDNKISYSNASDILGLNIKTLLGEV